MSAAAAIGPSMRYHGGKWRLAPWIIEHFPAHRVYVEPYGGAAGVLLRKPASYAEVYNDLDGDVVNLFHVLRSPDLRYQLLEALTLTPYSREEFTLAWAPCGDPVEKARRLVIRAEQGFGSAGATKGNTGFRVDVKRQYQTAIHVWSRVPDRLRLVAERFSEVMLERCSALELMPRYDGDETLFYIDPPYEISTRKTRNAYRHEMSLSGHRDLLAQLRAMKGFVVLSGYEHAAYDELLHDWTRIEKTVACAGQRGAVGRTELLYLNPKAAHSLKNRAGAVERIV